MKKVLLIITMATALLFDVAALGHDNLVVVPLGGRSLSPIAEGTVTSAGGQVWMNRNLGASRVALSSTDQAAYGDLYQWGRLDDGHESRTSLADLTLSASDASKTLHFYQGACPPL